MRHSEHDRLLKEVLGGDGPKDIRKASLELSLAALRRRRHHRRMAGTGLIALLLVAGVVMVLEQTRRNSGSTVARANAPAPAVSAPQPDTPPAVKFITDDELLALFPNRSVGLIGSPGHQTLVFFDQPASQQ